jgi:uncharacterized membrane protein YeaQ/YmgE (transglycosylase-associated protein family)
MSKYSKAIAAVGALCGVVASAVADGNVTQAEAGAIASAAIGVVAVFLVRNTTPQEG